ncbi:hypothetical protein ACTWJ8_40680 (plasmid) [Streptomyces sp. SDT5-1]|uniref:hypothetical protein n=1 Tax=Streptomyces sp. SDT5-1 TaxID=3406418 RepID=UPI003FD4F5B1
MTDIRMSDDVRAVLGTDGVAKAGAVTLHHAICVSCEGKVHPNEPVNVVVRLGSRVAHVRYAHARCHPSAVLDIPAPRAPESPAETPDAGMTMEMTAATVEHGQAVLPTLIAELAAPVYLVTGTGDGSELQDALASRVLQRGFSLVGRMRHAPAHAEGWKATYTTPDADGVAELAVTEPDGTLFYSGTIIPPAPWITGVEQYGWSVLYVGKIGLAGLPTADQKARTRLLRDAAAAAGQFVGGRVTVHHADRAGRARPTHVRGTEG